VEEDLRVRLTGNAAISALVKSAAIAWGERPQASGLPGITLDHIDDARPQHMTDFQALRGTQVQVDVWSKDKLEARDLRELVIPALVPAADVGGTSFRRSFVDRLASSYERTDVGVIYRERIDFTIWHAAAA
jgi:hypothetical protein